MSGTRRTAERATRLTLALLTLLAALLHLTRSPQAGGLGLPGSLAAGAAPRTAAPMADGMPGMDRPAAAGAHAQRGAGAGSAPEHAHHAEAHCPFCLSPGFALPASALPSLRAPAPTGYAPGVLAPTPHLAPLRHADPRAPPHAG